MRYERKYRIEEATRQEVESVLKQNLASFQVAFPDRQVNSIYLDTIQFHALQDNLGGIADRYKYRIRWYGENWRIAKKPILEKKIKHNQLGDKEYQSVPDFELNHQLDMNQYLGQHTDIDLTLQPVVLIRYTRNYFVSQNQQIRATIDSDLEFYFFQGNMLFEHSIRRDDAIILEVKYEEDMDEHVDHILQGIPFRLTKNSKFVNGVLQQYF